jgi:hypothetical protein
LAQFLPALALLAKKGDKRLRSLRVVAAREHTIVVKETE